MTVPTPATPTPLPPGPFAARAENLSSTLKWLMASGGAIAAVIVAGLQLTSLKDLQLWAALLAEAGVAVALFSVGGMLLGASRVLAVDAPTITELSNADLINPGPHSAASEDPLRRVLHWVQERRTSLLGDAASVTELYTDGIVGARKALEHLRRKERFHWAGRDLSPDSASDLAWVEAQYAANSGLIDQLEVAVSYWVKRTAYVNLIEKSRGLFMLFLAGILLFAIAPVLGPTAAASRVDAPLPAQVYVRDGKAAGLPSTCPATLSGQIVGGPLDRPTVVTAPTGTCPALKLTADNEALIVVPDASPSDS